MNQVSKIRSILPYPGGKRRELGKIAEVIPENWDTFVDVFGGSGSVIFGFMCDKSKHYHYNDINTTLVETMQMMTDYKKAISFERNYGDTEITTDLVKSSIDNRDRDILNFVISQKYSFLAFATQPDVRRCKGKLIDKYKPSTFAQKTHGFSLQITNNDYRQILETYRDSEDAVLYLDPPYISKDTRQYGYSFTISDLEYIFQFMETSKCKVILHIDYTAYTRETFSKFYKCSYQHTYNASSMGNKEDIYKKYHLLCCNYWK